MPTLNDFIVLQASVDALQLHEINPQSAAALTEGIEKATAKAIELLLAERLPKHVVNEATKYYFQLDGDTLSIYSPKSKRLLYLSYDDWE